MNEMIKAERNKICSRKQTRMLFLAGVVLIVAYFFFFQFNYQNVFYDYDLEKMALASGFTAIEQRKEVAEIFEGKLSQNTLLTMQEKIDQAKQATVGQDENSAFSAVHVYRDQAAILEYLTNSDGSFKSLETAYPNSPTVTLGYCDGWDKLLSGMGSITRLYRWSKAETEKPQTQQSSLTALWEAQQQLNAPHTRTGKIRALQESAALFSFLQANGIQFMQQLHEKIADMNSRYYDLRGKIVKAERRITTLTERGEMWEQYNQYKSIHKQLAKVKPEKREQFEQRHSRELILYDAAARYLKELKDSGEAITPKAWQWEIDQLTAGKQTDTLAMKSMREDLKAVERLRKTAEHLSRQERDKPHDREPDR